MVPSAIIEEIITINMIIIAVRNDKIHRYIYYGSIFMPSAFVLFIP